MSQTDDGIVYPRLQGAVNYHSWKQNMISLFKRKRAYEIALGKEPKPAKPAYPKKLTKLQFRDRQIAAQAASQAVSSAGSTTVTPQSGESIAITVTGVPASQPSSEPPILT